jgi:citrate synthase
MVQSKGGVSIMTLATKGLEGVTAAASSISSIENGVLTYRGYSIDDLAENASFEDHMPIKLTSTNT